MIGQVNLQKQFQQLKLPTLLILQGDKGSGRHTLIQTLFKDAIEIGVKVDAIRKMIEMCQKIANQVYVIYEADMMSVQAQNALLKVVEEGTNNNKFILTTTSADKLLPTIKSRGYVYSMESYKRDDILEYCSQNGVFSNIDRIICGDVCEVPGEVNLLKIYGIQSFYDYVELVIDNIAEVSGANVFKIADKLALKDEEPNKYDLTLFLRAFRRRCMEKAVCPESNSEDSSRYLEAIIITTKFIRQLRTKGVNKQMLVDAWILDIRKARM